MPGCQHTAAHWDTCQQWYSQRETPAAVQHRVKLLLLRAAAGGGGFRPSGSNIRGQVADQPPAGWRLQHTEPGGAAQLCVDGSGRQQGAVRTHQQLPPAARWNHHRSPCDRSLSLQAGHEPCAQPAETRPGALGLFPLDSRDWQWPGTALLISCSSCCPAPAAGVSCVRVTGQTQRQLRQLMTTCKYCIRVLCCTVLSCTVLYCTVLERPSPGHGGAPLRAPAIWSTSRMTGDCRLATGTMKFPPMKSSTWRAAGTCLAGLYVQIRGWARCRHPAQWQISKICLSVGPLSGALLMAGQHAHPITTCARHCAACGAPEGDLLLGCGFIMPACCLLCVAVSTGADLPCTSSSTGKSRWRRSDHVKQAPAAAAAAAAAVTAPV